MANMYNSASQIYSLLLQEKIGQGAILDILDNYSLDEIFSNPNLVPSLAHKIIKAKEDLDKNTIKMQQSKVKYISILDDDYPKMLKEIYKPPVLLNYVGEWENILWDSCISIVGTRRCTSYGRRICQDISGELASRGFCIVSGMAMGIDNIAHNSTIANNGKTVAILATSADRPSPVTNTQTYNKILNSGGVIVSETLPGQEVVAGMFARRNRLVAGISKATIVIEAGIKSGSLITANLAFENDRYVFAIPGNINQSSSAGCNYLIKQTKAKLVQDIDDILIELGFEKANNRSEDVVLSKLSFDEQLIYDMLVSGPKLTEDIAKLISKPISAVLPIISSLELKGIIYKKENNKFCISI